MIKFEKLHILISLKNINAVSYTHLEMMNQKAKELNLKNTHFENVTGLHDNNHYTCPYDLAMMASYLIKIGGDKLLSVTSLYDSYIREDTKQSFWLVNTNKLLKLYDGVEDVYKRQILMNKRM